MHTRISGIVPPMTTPFRADDTIDQSALQADTRYLIETARAHGLAVTGSTGEGHALSTDEVRRITAVVSQEAAGRVPVITGIITDSTASAVERGLAVKDPPRGPRPRDIRCHTQTPAAPGARWHGTRSWVAVVNPAGKWSPLHQHDRPAV